MISFGEGLPVELLPPVPPLVVEAVPRAPIGVLVETGPPGPPGASIYVSLPGWDDDPVNPANGGALPAGMLVLERVGGPDDI